MMNPDEQPVLDLAAWTYGGEPITPAVSEQLWKNRQMSAALCAYAILDDRLKDARFNAERFDYFDKTWETISRARIERGRETGPVNLG